MTHRHFPQRRPGGPERDVDRCLGCGKRIVFVPQQPERAEHWRALPKLRA